MDECIQHGVATLKCIPILFNSVIAQGVAFASIGLLFFIAFSATKFLTSGGDPIKVASAKKSLTYAIIGFILIVGAFLIVKTIATITGTKCIVIGLEC